MGKHSVSLKLLTITYFHNKESSLMSNKIGLGGCLINLLIPWRKKKTHLKNISQNKTDMNTIHLF